MRGFVGWSGAAIVAGLVTVSIHAGEVTSDFSSPKAAVKIYLKAELVGDVETAKKAAVMTPDQEKLLEAASKEHVSKARLIEVLNKRFGEEATKKKIAQATTFLLAIVDAATVKIDGDRAWIGQHGDFECERIDGRWRWDRTRQKPVEPVAASIDRCEKENAINDRLAKEVGEGKWASLDAVIQERQQFIPPPPGFGDAEKTR